MADDFIELGIEGLDKMIDKHFDKIPDQYIDPHTYSVRDNRWRTRNRHPGHDKKYAQENREHAQDDNNMTQRPYSPPSSRERSPPRRRSTGREDRRRRQDDGSRIESGIPRGGNNSQRDHEWGPILSATPSIISPPYSPPQAPIDRSAPVEEQYSYMPAPGPPPAAAVYNHNIYSGPQTGPRYAGVPKGYRDPSGYNYMPPPPPVGGNLNAYPPPGSYAADDDLRRGDNPGSNRPERAARRSSSHAPPRRDRHRDRDRDRRRRSESYDRGGKDREESGRNGHRDDSSKSNENGGDGEGGLDKSKKWGLALLGAAVGGLVVSGVVGKLEAEKKVSDRREEKALARDRRGAEKVRMGDADKDRVRGVGWERGGRGAGRNRERGGEGRREDVNEGAITRRDRNGEEKWNDAIVRRKSERRSDGRDGRRRRYNDYNEGR